MGMLVEPAELNYSAVIFTEMWCESSRLRHYPPVCSFSSWSVALKVFLYVLFFTEWSNLGARVWHSASQTLVGAGFYDC